MARQSQVTESERTRRSYRPGLPRLACFTALAGLVSAYGTDLPSVEWRTHVTSVREQTFVSPQAKNSIQVVSWNVDHGANLDRLASEMAGDRADLCLLQEVDWGTKRTGEEDVAAKLAGRLGLNLAYGIEFEELSQEKDAPAFIGQATLTRLPIRRSRVLAFRTSVWLLAAPGLDPVVRAIDAAPDRRASGGGF